MTVELSKETVCRIRTIVLDYLKQYYDAKNKKRHAFIKNRLDQFSEYQIPAGSRTDKVHMRVTPATKPWGGG